MTELIKKSLRESVAARWTALLLMSFTMLFAYTFIDALAPFGLLLEREFGWTPDVFGTVAGSAYFLNIIGFMLIAGIILDRIGVRRSTIVASILMLIGAVIKAYGVSYTFIEGGFGYEFFSSFWTGVSASAKVAMVGFAIFGAGVEMAGITVTRAIVKWFKGKELALALAMQVSIARLGVVAVFFLLPRMEVWVGFSTTILLAALCVCIAILGFGVYFFMDLKLERQEKLLDAPDEEQFRFADLKQIFTSKAFMIIAFLCLLYYISIFTFQKFAVGMLEARLPDSPWPHGDLFMFLPIGAMFLTPLLGTYLDNRGKGATMLIWGSGLMVVCHTIFALVPDSMFSFPLALTTIIVLGVSFSLVPAALWPAVPKLVEDKVVGSAYATIFWIQNIGLWGAPILIGTVLMASNPGVDINVSGVFYDYTVVMLVFASFGVAALLLGFWLKAEDKKKGYGLELPNK
ncbi:MAG: MFS transporter [Bacteroidales bacterium]|nr:MFS transporter [Bacteroidales bacterium]